MAQIQALFPIKTTPIMPTIQQDDIGLFTITEEGGWLSRPLLATQLKPGAAVHVSTLKGVVSQVESGGIKEAWLRCGMPALNAAASRRNVSFFLGLAGNAVQETQDQFDQGIQPTFEPPSAPVMPPIAQLRAARMR